MNEKNLLFWVIICTFEYIMDQHVNVNIFLCAIWCLVALLQRTELSNGKQEKVDFR